MRQVYYAAPIWITSLKSGTWRRINSAHYRALPAARTWCWMPTSYTLQMGQVHTLIGGHQALQSFRYQHRKYIDSSSIHQRQESVQSQFRWHLQADSWLPVSSKLDQLHSKIVFDWVNQDLSDVIKTKLKKDFLKYLKKQNINKQLIRQKKFECFTKFNFS